MVLNVLFFRIIRASKDNAPTKQRTSEQSTSIHVDVQVHSWSRAVNCLLGEGEFGVSDHPWMEAKKEREGEPEIWHHLGHSVSGSSPCPPACIFGSICSIMSSVRVLKGRGRVSRLGDM